MRTIFREVAYDDLRRIHAWISKDNPRAADAVVTRILDAVDRLGVFPRLGHVGRWRGTREWLSAAFPM